MGALLGELADWFEFEGVGGVDLLVCGGTAMGLQYLNRRPTRDVDVLGMWDRELVEVACMDDFPEKVKACIRRVAANHPRGFWRKLGESWSTAPGPTRAAAGISIAFTVNDFWQGGPADTAPAEPSRPDSTEALRRGGSVQQTSGDSL